MSDQVSVEPTAKVIDDIAEELECNRPANTPF